MKKSLLVMGLVSTFALNASAADLFGSLKKVSESVDAAQAKVTETQAKVESTTAAASSVTVSPEESALALVKSKLGDKQATQAQVKAKLGAPVATNGEKGAEVWLYDASSINATAAQAAEIAAAFNVNTAATAKQVAIHFAGDKVSNIAIAEAAAAAAE